MIRKKKIINKKLKQFGKTLGLDENSSINAKRTTKNTIVMAFFAGLLFVLGRFMMPGGPAGLYYTGVSIKDFQMLFGGLI